MSHHWYLYCPRCRQSGERVNHGQKLLIQAVQQSYPLWLLQQTEWDAGSCDLHGCSGRGLAEFVLEHWGCGGFEVRSEYVSERPIAVRPDVPNYAALVLPNLIERAEQERGRLTALLEECRAEAR